MGLQLIHCTLCNRPIIYLDATFISTRRETVSKEAYYIALAVKADASREIIGIYNAPTEAASIWQDVIDDLKLRGLQHCGLFVTDDLTGLENVIEQNFANTTLQKCVLHLKRNILKKTTKTHRQAVADDLKHVFELEKPDDTLEQALSRCQAFHHKWQPYYSHLKFFNDPQKMRYYFSYLNYDPKIRNMLYTTNWIERLNKDFKPTVNMRNSMPSVESVLTLLSKVAMDKNYSRYRYPIYRLKFDSMFQ